MPSHVIRSFDYDAGERRLHVKFVSGRRYDYFGVPPETYEGMRRSFSKGEFFNTRIRNRFRFRRRESDS